MQLTEQAVVASGCSVGSSTAGSGLSQSSRVAGRTSYAPVPVSGLDSGAVTDEDDQQQTEPTFQVGATILDCLNQHAGHCTIMLDSGKTPESYTNFLLKGPPDKEKQPQINVDLRRFAFICGRLSVFLLVLLYVNIAAAQVHSRVTISISNQSRITVDAELSTPIASWSFRNAYAGVLGIAERIENFRAADAVVEKAATGEFRSDRKVSKISYTVNVSRPTLADVSHVSWVVDKRGVLMLADLVPLDVHDLGIEFKLPEGWTVESSFPRDANGRYEVVAPERAVFLVGRSLRKTSNTVEGIALDLVVSGNWPFGNNKVVDAAAKVMKEYAAMTGFRLPGKSVIMIAPFPVAPGYTKWKAETRGSTLVLLIDPSADSSNWIGQLGVIFTHELLHLWVPNSLNLEGDYDWFFEGFTLYTALRTALALKIINFKEYLDTLARVYDFYLSFSYDASLIDASERRWTTADSFVYNKGMLVAFFYDLVLRKESAGKLTLTDKYRELFNRPAAEHANGNEVIIALLGSSPAVRELTKSYIENGTQLNLEKLLPAYGFTLDSPGGSPRLRVSQDLTAEQKQLLQSLGYRG